jgi:hypothetical protein
VIQALLEYGRFQVLSGLGDNDTLATVTLLASEKLVMHVAKLDQKTLNDRYLDEENAEVAKAGGLLTATELKKLKARMSAERNARIADGPTGSKRKLLMTSDEFEKIQQLYDQETFFESDICFKVNVEQFHIHFRNRDLVEFVASRFDETASRITALFLEQVESKMSVTKEKQSINQSLPSFGLAVSNAKIDIQVGKATANPLKEYMELLSEDQEPIFQKDSIGGNQYNIQLEYCTQQMCIQVLEQIIRQKFGAVAFRIWKVLQIKKKLDDKQVCTLY